MGLAVHHRACGVGDPSQVPARVAGWHRRIEDEAGGQPADADHRQQGRDPARGSGAQGAAHPAEAAADQQQQGGEEVGIGAVRPQRDRMGEGGDDGHGEDAQRQEAPAGGRDHADDGEQQQRPLVDAAHQGEHLVRGEGELITEDAVEGPSAGTEERTRRGGREAVLVPVVGERGRGLRLDDGEVQRTDRRDGRGGGHGQRHGGLAAADPDQADHQVGARGHDHA